MTWFAYFQSEKREADTLVGFPFFAIPQYPKINEMKKIIFFTYVRC